MARLSRGRHEAGGAAEGAAILTTADCVRPWAALAGYTATPHTVALLTTVPDGTTIQRPTYGECQAGVHVV